MIVYQANKTKFLEDAFKRDIEQVVLDSYRVNYGRKVSKAEIRSWKESLTAIAKALNHEAIPNDCGLAVEFGIPQTSKRIDVLISGKDRAGRDTLLIVELKQWQQAELTAKDGIVRTRFEHGLADCSHPSYQVWSYAELLRNFNEVVFSEGIPIVPCAYLHNAQSGGALVDPFYAEHVANAPLFFSGEAERKLLQAFIAKHVTSGGDAKLIYRVEQGRVRPSRRLIDALQGMLAGKKEFVLVDDQKVVFETAVASAKAGCSKLKQVVIIEGGPGTGKSVVAINLLVALTAQELLTKYVTKNRAPRQVFEQTLSGTYRRSKIESLFSGSGEFIGATPNQFDALVVDEAHRLNAKSGIFSNLGNNQIEEIVAAAKCSIFFIDEDQRVTWKDIGSKEQIERLARAAGATIAYLKLESQFRCNGSDGYIAWLDSALGIRHTANQDLGKSEFDFEVFSSPNAMLAEIRRRNTSANRARLVAGYCWDWKSKSNPDAMDIVIPEHGFSMQWNLAEDEGRWITAPNSVEQVGCIHTCQGLELDYVGVIIGPDLMVRDGVVVTNPKQRSKHDQSIKGYKALAKTNAKEAQSKADALIKNTYRTLMTRGMKGCFLYCTDAETAEYFRLRTQGTGVSARTLQVADRDNPDVE